LTSPDNKLNILPEVKFKPKKAKLKKQKQTFTIGLISEKENNNKVMIKLQYG